MRRDLRAVVDILVTIFKVPRLEAEILVVQCAEEYFPEPLVDLKPDVIAPNVDVEIDLRPAWERSKFAKLQRRWRLRYANRKKALPKRRFCKFMYYNKIIIA